MNDTPTFESSISELEALVEKLEQGQLPLDESLRLYEHGMTLAQRCQTQLDEARLVLEKLGDAQDSAGNGAPPSED